MNIEIKKILLIVTLISLSLSSFAQKNIVKELRQNKLGEGKVRIFQDPRLDVLIGETQFKSLSVGEQKVIKSSGYRVQVYTGNNSRQARTEANEVGKRVKELFPDLSVYTSFYPPRWLCRVGDFRSIEEADALMSKLKKTGKFKEASIVKEQILIPLY